MTEEAYSALCNLVGDRVCRKYGGRVSLRESLWASESRDGKDSRGLEMRVLVFDRSICKVRRLARPRS